MKRAIAFQKELAQINTIEGLTSVFESIASLRIAQIKDKVESSSAFFNELWKIYTALRVDPATRMQATENQQHRDKPQAFIVITSEGGLSGDIDQRIVERMLKVYDPAKADVIVIGAHGANQLLVDHDGKAAGVCEIAELYSLKFVGGILDHAIHELFAGGAV